MVRLIAATRGWGTGAVYPDLDPGLRGLGAGPSAWGMINPDVASSGRSTDRWWHGIHRPIATALRPDHRRLNERAAVWAPSAPPRLAGRYLRALAGGAGRSRRRHHDPSG